MLTSVRALAVASLLLAPTLLLGANAATQVPDTAGLQFQGFRAGARLEELQLHLRSIGGSRLRCRQSRVDRRVNECRAVLTATEGGPVELWVSAMDSLAGVITLSGVLAPGQLERWREALEESYGRTGPRVQGTQWMLQWVRRGRMIRLTWRLERAGKVVSVSLVDGHVLDGWGRSSPASTRPSPAPAQPASRAR